MAKIYLKKVKVEVPACDDCYFGMKQGNFKKNGLFYHCDEEFFSGKDFENCSGHIYVFVRSEDK